MHETPNGHGVKSIDFNSPQSIIWHYGFFALPTYNEIDWQYYQPTKKSFWMQTRWSNDGIINTITIWISRHLTHSPEVFHDSFPTLTLRVYTAQILLIHDASLMEKKIDCVSRCLKIKEKVSFSIASEASYVYNRSGQKLIKNAKNGQFWRVFENLKLSVKQCYQTGQF